MISRRSFVAKFAAAFGAVAAVGKAAVAAPCERRELVAEKICDRDGNACFTLFHEPKCKPIIIGRPLVFGVPEVIKPIPMVVRAGARVRFVFRQKHFARVYVRENGMTVAWHIEDKGTHWEPTLPVGANAKEAK